MVLRDQYDIHPLYFNRLHLGHSFNLDHLIDSLVNAATYTVDGSLQLLWLQDLPIASSTAGLTAIHFQFKELADPQAPSVVVLSSSTVDGRLSLTKWLKAHAQCQTFSRLALWKAEKLVAQAQSIAAVKAIRLDRMAAEVLINWVGNDTRLLHQAVEVLALHGGVVTAELVHQLIPAQSTDGIAFSRALLARDVVAAMSELERTLMRNEAPLRLIALTTSQLRLWLGVKAATLATPHADHARIARAIELPGSPNRVYFLKQEVAAISLPMLVGLLKQEVATEKLLKSGADETIAMRQLVLAVGKVT
jgi:DNA polymerase III subunit delta